MTDIHVIAPGSPVWREFAASEGVVLRTLTHPGETTLDGVFAARRHWLVQKSAVLLLGDVVFSEKTIDLIGEDRGGMRFYGRLGANAVTGCPWGELFGMRISVRRQRMVLRLLAKPAFRHGRSHGTGFGLLWNLYYEMLETVGSSILLDPNDFTDDIDTPADLAALPRLNNAIRSEGLMRSRLGAK